MRVECGRKSMDRRGKKSRLPTMLPRRTGIHCSNKQDGTDSGKDIQLKFEMSLRHSDGDIY